jgi:uncharacterized protein
MKSLLMTVIFLFLFGLFFVAPAASREEPVSVSNRQNIKAVYEITKDEWEQGVGSGLYAIKAAIGLYKKMGIVRDQLDLHGVVHGDAGYFLLTDEAYNKEKKTRLGNPNTGIIRELTEAGVSLDLCSQTMKQNGWTAKDILPEITIVVDAYSRIVDLQDLDFSYIKF